MDVEGAGNDAGFSLVELLIAISILSVGLLAVATMQTVAVSQNSVSHKLMVATELAKEAMEDIMAWDCGDPNVNTNLSNASYRTNAQVPGGGSFNITYSTTINTPIPGTTQVNVTVTEAPPSPHGISAITISSFKRVQ